MFPQWQFQGRSVYGRIGDVYAAFHMMNDFTAAEKEDRIFIASALKSGCNGVVVEVVSGGEASGQEAFSSMDRFVEFMRERWPVYVGANQDLKAEPDLVETAYRTRRGDRLVLSVPWKGEAGPSVNGRPVTWDDYPVT